MAPLLAAHGLALGHGRDEVLAGIDWRIRPGETWFVLGPNGAGKSTLLAGLLGLLPPRRGRIALAAALADRRRMAWVPQRLPVPAAIPASVRESTALGLLGLGLGRGAGAARVAAALACTGLAPQAGRQLATLSGGQLQRAAIARALVRRPLLLLVDEPTASLDPAGERDLVRLILGPRRDPAMAVVFVAHDPDLALAHASHLALVADGGVRAGALGELAAEVRARTPAGGP